MYAKHRVKHLNTGNWMKTIKTCCVFPEKCMRKRYGAGYQSPYVSYIHISGFTLDLKFEIRINTYPEDVVSVYISSDMWNYAQLLGIEVQRTLVGMVKQLSHAKCFVERQKRTVYIWFSRRAYVSGIDTNCTTDHGGR